MKPTWKCLLIGVVAAMVLSTAAPQADAQCWLYSPTAWGYSYTPYYSGYSSCCATTVSCYSPCCYDSCGWTLGWRPGPIRRLFLGRYRWYSNGGWGCYSTCNQCGLTDGCGCTGDSVAPSAPTPSPTPAKKPIADPAIPDAAVPAVPAPAEPSADATSAAESGFLTIWVPHDAKVTVNGLETKSTGSRRQFVSFGLKPGLSYKYEVRAQVIRNGQMEEDARTVILTAGEISAVAFGFNVPAHQMASVQ